MRQSLKEINEGKLFRVHQSDFLLTNIVFHFSFHKSLDTFRSVSDDNDDSIFQKNFTKKWRKDINKQHERMKFLVFTSTTLQCLMSYVLSDIISNLDIFILLRVLILLIIIVVVVLFLLNCRDNNEPRQMLPGNFSGKNSHSHTILDIKQKQKV